MRLVRLSPSSSSPIATLRRIAPATRAIITKPCSRVITKVHHSRILQRTARSLFLSRPAIYKSASPHLVLLRHLLWLSLPSVWTFPTIPGIMGNAQRRNIDGVSYSISADMIKVRKQSWKEYFVTSFAWNYIGVPIFAVLAPVWYLLVSNFDWVRQLSGQLAYFLMPWLDETFRDVKRELTKDVRGRVLDVGSGQGSWLKYCSQATVVTELEPIQEHLPPLRQSVEEFSKQNPSVRVEIVNRYMEEFQPDELYDIVILGNVLCEVKDPTRFLHDVDRVLRPGGKVIFQEHIREAPGTVVGYLQDLFNMYWKVASKGCNCNRDPVKYLKSIGKWQVEAWDLRVKGTTMLFNRCAVGIAIKSKGP